jgi:integrase
MDSKFSQQYDNQQYDEADRSLTSDEMDKLIMLRNDFKKGVIQITAYKKSKTIPEKVQIKQRIQKMNNLKRTLDCFLFMCSTGLYLADIEKVGLSIRNVDNKVSYMTYRRAKNDSYCKGILIKDFGCFLGKTLIMEYGIKSGSNFPMKLSRNHVGKNLKIISELVGFDFYITSKMARKTFASLYFFIYDLGINDVQMMLGHKDSKQTMHYLRITDDDLALRIHEKIKQIA